MSGLGSRLVRGGLLLWLAALIGKLFVSGEMIKYMSPALDPLTAVTGGVLAVMGALELWRGSDHAHHGAGSGGIEQGLTYLLVLVPIVLGATVTPRALGSSALGGEDVSRLLLAYAPSGGPSGGSPSAASGEEPIDGVAELLAYLERVGESGAGRRVRAVGMALPSDRLGVDEFALLRFSIAHCVADARPVGLLVIASGDLVVRADQWVAVEGVLGVREREGDRLVTILADRIEPTVEPPNPCL